jgi:DNA-binding MarR family transcriptional regulator
MVGRLIAAGFVVRRVNVQDRREDRLNLMV